MNMHGGFEEMIVFDKWMTHSVGTLIGSCIALALIAALYEGIKTLREWLIKLDVKRINEYSSNYSILRYLVILD
jgi:copper transporter 1